MPLPRAETGHRERGALDVGEAHWSRREHNGRNHGVFGGDAVSVERRQREDLFSHLDVVHVGSHVGDHARQLV
jgi:hypothetical protein